LTVEKWTWGEGGEEERARTSFFWALPRVSFFFFGLPAVFFATRLPTGTSMLSALSVTKGVVLV
jgi:hypothetical protein